MDVKPALDWVVANWSSVALALSIGVLVYLLTQSATWRRLTGAIEHSFFTNWQLGLLGTTGIVLSLASGWTTWDGMRNFTGEPILSLMVTFGIQGVMLIVAWLIGESFATGMSHRGKGSVGLAEKLGGSAAGVLLFLALLLWFASGTTSGSGGSSWFNSAAAHRLMEYSAFAAVALLLVAVIWSFRNSDLTMPYLQGGRVIIRNAVLWVMFLACMATSVFFSFDSLFSAIFPQSERARAADLRAQNQVSGIVSDIGTTISTRRISEAEGLFSAKGWLEYEGNLLRLSQQAQGAQGEIERYFVQQMEERRRSIAQQQERIATAQSGQAGLAGKKTSLTEELSRLTADRPGLASEYAQHKSELDAKAKEIDAKRVEAMAEERGVEGTGKVGKGQVYRQRAAELAKLQDEFKIKQERTRDAERRLAQVQGRIEQIRRELSAIDGDLAKLKGEAETADQRIKVAEQTGASEEGPKIDPARVLPAFERARAEFRADPTEPRLSALQQQCAQLLGAMMSTPATKDRVRGIDCDPKSAAEASQRVFALNAGWDVFNAHCSGGDKLPQTGGADALFSFARKCAQDAGLPSKDTETLRTKINFIELNRDDKAHRFVVTWNAFLDGNRLAYLALAIAIAIDSLVFMSGLFGANAVRSPLSDVPSAKPRSARQLEQLLETALGEEHERYDHARIVFRSLRPSHDPHYSMEVAIQGLTPSERDAVLPVLSAGREIGAVAAHPDRPGTYLVRGELFEFVGRIANKRVVNNSEQAREHELKKIVVSSLQPHVGDHADIVLHHCHPISERQGFSAEMFATRMSADDRFIVQRTLNAGATLGYVQLDDRADQQALGRYYVHKQLYKTLLLIAAAYPRTGLRSYAPALGAPQSGPAFGGVLGSGDAGAVKGPDRKEAIAAEERRQITRQQRPGEAAESAEQLKAHCWSKLVGALGVDPQVALARLNTEGTEAQALEAWQMLDDLASHNAALSHYLESFKKELEDARSEAYSALRRWADGVERRADALEGVDGHLDRVFPALMLFPEVGLLDHLIGSIERAAQPDEGLEPGEQELKDRLVQVRDGLLGADLGSPQTWRWVGGQLADLSQKYKDKIARLARRQGDQRRTG